jgi:hypothetical protein
MSLDDSNEVLEFLQEKGDSLVKLSTAERKRLAELGLFIFIVLDDNFL